MKLELHDVAIRSAVKIGKMSLDSYNNVLREAMKLPPPEQQRLAEALLAKGGKSKTRSIMDFFGVLGPAKTDAQERVRRLRDEWSNRER